MKRLKKWNYAHPNGPTGLPMKNSEVIGVIAAAKPQNNHGIYNISKRKENADKWDGKVYDGMGRAMMGRDPG